MASKVKTTDYMYCSARIRALETRLLGADGLRAVADASGLEGALSRLSELGYETVRLEDGTADVEGTIQKIYTDACRLLDSMLPYPELTGFMRYPYDCNNLKACIKCGIRGISPDGMLYDCGVYSADDARAAVAGEYSVYPEHMSAAVGEATEAYAKNKNPQSIDLILDRACYADMLNAAVASKCELAAELVRTRIDITNIIIFIRIARMNMGRTGLPLLSGALLCGGEYGIDFFTDAYDGGESGLCELLAFSKYEKFIRCICENPNSLSQVEKYADDIYMELARRAKSVPFGPEVAIGYLIAVEYEVKNLRIILDAKRAGRTVENILQGMRCAYV